MNKTISESGMSFVSDNVFHIEKSPQYAELGNRVKTVEFVRTKGEKLLFVEAKSSFPKPYNMASNQAKGNKTGEELFHKEVVDICDKFIHSLNLYSAINVGVTKDGFPSDYKPADKVTLMFILVINGFKMSWCVEIEKALNQRIRESICMSKIWKPEVIVINNETAAKNNITVN
ncbi:MAG: hypothetical protein LBC02_13060 [Planctomycetaceae bacterium]|jgi:hypothetical protein|nr:hypothetical protein [Planctomycetaceae bacterium]